MIVDGGLAEVIEACPGGDVHVRDVRSLKSRWVDYFICELVDPNESPEMLLTALGELFEASTPRSDSDVGANDGAG